jgi:hypothetical protein
MTAGARPARSRQESQRTLAETTHRRWLMLAAPALVPLSMSVVFAALTRRISPRAAYNLGFGLYWLGWCGAFPLWVLGPRRAGRALLAVADPPRPRRPCCWYRRRGPR